MDLIDLITKIMKRSCEFSEKCSLEEEGSQKYTEYLCLSLGLGMAAKMVREYEECN